MLKKKIIQNATLSIVSRYKIQNIFLRIIFSIIKINDTNAIKITLRQTSNGQEIDVHLQFADSYYQICYEIFK